jgi:hypothetical protein
MFSWEYTKETNTLCLNDERMALASDSPDRIIILCEMTLRNIRTRYANFKRELYDSLYQALSKTPAEFAAWHGSEKYDFEEGICTSQSCVAFKRLAIGSNRLNRVQFETRSTNLPRSLKGRRSELESTGFKLDAV